MEMRTTYLAASNHVKNTVAASLNAIVYQLQFQKDLIQASCGINHYNEFIPNYDDCYM